MPEGRKNRRMNAPDSFPRLLCMRHGAVTEAVRGRLYGRLDVPLSEAGREQIRRAAQALRRDLAADGSLPPLRLISSPLSRCRESAALVREALRGADGSLPPLLVDDDLAEIALGQWEGLPKAEIRRRFPAQWAARGTDMAHAAPPGGENFAGAQQRALAAVRRLAAGYPDESLLLLSHAGLIRCLMAHVLALPLQEVLRLPLPFAAVVRLDREGIGPVGKG